MSADNPNPDQQGQGQPGAAQPTAPPAQSATAGPRTAPPPPPSAPPPPPPGPPATKAQIWALGIFLLVFGLLLVYLFINLWPAGLSPDASGAEASEVSIFHIFPLKGLDFKIPLDAKLIVLVMIAGGLGSYVHVATSFSVFVANQKLTQSWMWWYVLRPFIGMVLAVVFYLAIRGGFLSVGNDAGKINPYGIAGMAALVGMFSKQAVEKLNELFNTLFKTADSQGQGNPVPSIDAVQPSSLKTGTTDLGIKITGKGFVGGVQVQVNGANRNTVLVDGTHLTATLAASDVANKGDLNLTVVNPKPGGGTSNAVKIAVA
jgi:hypothetical protein